MEAWNEVFAVLALFFFFLRKMTWKHNICFEFFVELKMYKYICILYTDKFNTGNKILFYIHILFYIYIHDKNVFVLMKMNENEIKLNRFNSN